MSEKTRFFQAVAVMIGYIIGVGMFGLPFIVAKAGLWPFFGFIAVFGAIQYFQHIIYANIIVATDGFHREPGYAGIYLGKAGKNLLAVAKIGGNYGALLAYLIIIGIFLYELLGPVLGGSEFFYSSLVFALSALVVLLGLKTVAKTELVMSALLILAVLMIAAKGLGAARADNYIGLDWAYLFLPFGATLMALDGNGSIPIVAKILRKDPAAVKKAVTLGTAVATAITIAFVLIVVGMSGANTSPDALVGIKRIIDNGVITFALIFGVLSISTSIILVSEAIKETLVWDFGMKERLAWALAVGAPYLMLVLGLDDLTEVISLAGGVAGGFAAIMLMLIFNRVRKLPGKLVLMSWNPPAWLLLAFSLLFMAGIFYELGHFLIMF